MARLRKVMAQPRLEFAFWEHRPAGQERLRVVLLVGMWSLLSRSIVDQVGRTCMDDVPGDGNGDAGTE